MTELHRRALNFILAFWAERGFAPSYTEIGVALGIKSRGSVHALLSRMKARGLIVASPRRARSIKVVNPID